VLLLARGQGDPDLEQDSLSSAQIRAVHKFVDSNTDGKVSLSEMMAYSAAMRKEIAAKDISAVLDEMDLDKDGRLSVDELIQDMQQWGEETEEDKNEKTWRIEAEKEKFNAADSDRDGYLDSEELPGLFYPETHDGVLALTTMLALKLKDKDQDGKLSLNEFWEEDPINDDFKITEEEKADFVKLDKNRDGFLDLEELKHWESGNFHTEEAMKQLFELADKDNDMHVTADEMDSAKLHIAGSDAQYHLMEWAEHKEL